MLLALAVQLVPYGWGKSNPTVLADAPWPNEETERLARGACYACHSNETEWPIYSYVAPNSWLVRRDVESGRRALNFSEWGDDNEADDAAEEILEGSMPPRRFRLLHPAARLSTEEKAQLIAALQAMERDDDDDDESGRRGRNRGRR